MIIIDNGITLLRASTRSNIAGSAHNPALSFYRAPLAAPMWQAANAYKQWRTKYEHVCGIRFTSIIFNYVDPRHCCNKFWPLLTDGLLARRNGGERAPGHVRPFDMANCLLSTENQTNREI